MTLPTSPVATQSSPPPEPLLFASVTQSEVTAGELIATTLAVWWRNAFRFAGVTLVVLFLPVAGLGFAAALVIPAMAGRGAALDGTAMTWAPFVPIVIVAVTMIVQTGALTYGAVQHLAGRPVRVGAMLAVGFRRALPILAAGLLFYVLVLAGLALLVVPGIIVACGLTVAIPAVVIERIGPIQALQRSWTLTRGHRMAIFAAGLALWVVLLAANAALQVAMTSFGSLATLVLLPVQLFVAALPTLMPAVAYSDLRTEKEGTDVDELAKVFE